MRVGALAIAGVAAQLPSLKCLDLNANYIPAYGIHEIQSTVKGDILSEFDENEEDMADEDDSEELEDYNNSVVNDLAAKIAGL